MNFCIQAMKLRQYFIHIPLEVLRFVISEEISDHIFYG